MIPFLPLLAGAALGAGAGGTIAKKSGKDPLKGAALGALGGGLGGWMLAPGAAAGTTGAGAAATGTGAGAAGTAAGTTAGSFTAAAPIAGTTASTAGASTALPAWAASSPTPTFWSGLGKNIATGVAVNGAVSGGNALLNPPPTITTPGQPTQFAPVQPLNMPRINFGPVQ